MCVSVYMCLIRLTLSYVYSFWWLPYQRESGATLSVFFFSFFLYYYLLFLTFRGHFSLFFSFSFLLSFRLISCRLVGCLVSYSLSPILICVSLFLFTVFFKYDVFRMLCYWFLYFFFLLLPRFFIIFPSDLSVGSLAHLISQFFGWLTPPARHTLHPPFACPTIRLLLRLSSTAGYMNGYTLCLIFFSF